MTENKNSQYDPGLIIKDVHDFHGQSIRVINTSSVVSKYHTHFRATYNGSDQPTSVSYYRGYEPHKTTLGCVADVAGSLQNTYITLNSAPDNKLFYIWFNVDGAGTSPALANATEIEIEINSNDPASVIAMAISLTINTLFKDYFKASRSNSVVEISTVGFGVVDNSTSVGTGFALTNVSGLQELVGVVEISYSGLDPIYKGQVLKGYRFNIFTAEFEHKEEAATSVNDVVWDQITTTFPDDTSEIYSYSLESSPVQDVLVTYVDASKKQIISVQKTRY